MRRQVLQSTREKPTDTDLEDKSKKNVVFVQPWTLAQIIRGGFTQIYADIYPRHQAEEIYTSTAYIYIIIMLS